MVEDDGDQPEAEPHRRHNRQGHQGRPSERAQGEADVSHQIVEQHRAAPRDVADLREVQSKDETSDGYCIVFHTCSNSRAIAVWPAFDG